MVVPWVSQEENIIDKLDKDFTYAAVLSEIKEAFNDKGFYTYDFVTAYNNAQINKALKWDKLQTVFQEIANNSPCDFYVKARINIQKAVDGANKIDILLEAVNNYSGLLVGNASFGKSNRTEDMVLLAQAALQTSDAFTFGPTANEQVKKSPETFLDQINRAFADMRENGRLVTVDFQVAEDSEIDLDTEVGKDYNLLSDLIIEWLKTKAYKDYVNDLSGDRSQLKVEMKVALRDETGNNYNVSKLAGEIRAYVAGLGTQTDSKARLRVNREFKGSNIYITIAGAN
jgi:hypothetical protein